VAGVDTPLAFPAATPYPYLGTLARAQALTSTPSMLASILMLAILLVACAWKAPGGCAWPWGLCWRWHSSSRSRSRSWACSPPVAAAYAMRQPHELRRPTLRLLATVATVLLLAAAYGGVSHFVILSESADRGELERGMFVSGAPLARFSFGSQRYAVFRTTYQLLLQ
jgi:hypothetical protein